MLDYGDRLNMLIHLNPIPNTEHAAVLAHVGVVYTPEVVTFDWFLSCSL